MKDELVDKINAVITKHYRESFEAGDITFGEVDAGSRCAEYVLEDKTKHGIWCGRLIDDISEVIRAITNWEYIIRGKKLIIYEV